MNFSRRTFLGALAASGLAGSTLVRATSARAQDVPNAPPELDGQTMVTRFADTLLRVGHGQGAPNIGALWPAVLDTRDASVPRGFAADVKVKSNREAITSVPPLPGVREGDRAVGGANLLHDSATVRLFPLLSQISGQARYGEASNAYCREFLRVAQNPQTGLLAWGEHLFYDVFEQKPSVHPYYSQKPLWPHELLGQTPPWQQLWNADADATARAIGGLRLHFYADEPGALFNRHANWDKWEFQEGGTKGESQPWIKHSALYTHAFAFLYARGGEEKWLDWARGAGAIYWNARDPQTNLVPSCLTDPRPTSQLAGSGMTHLVYWLYQAFELVPAQTQWRERALTLFHAYDRYAYDAQRDAYRARFPTDGTLHATQEAGDYATSWLAGYGDASTLPVQQGRVAAWLARREKDELSLEAARRIHRIARQTPVADDAAVSVLADALHLALDLHDLTGEAPFLRDAQFYAGESVKRFWRENEAGAFLARRAGDPYYEAKAGTGELAAGLLLLAQSSAPNAKSFAWEF